MTIQEAINILQNDQIISDEAINLAIEALQKQVPMKPKVSKGKFMEWYNCSACKGWLKGNEKFCDCGQRLDWSDVNE